MPESDCLSDAFIAQSTCCSWIITPTGEFLRAFGETQRIFRKPPDELTGHRYAEVLPEDLAPLWKDRIERALAGEYYFLRERFGTKDVAIGLFPVRFDGMLYAGGSALEITRWNTAEQELRHTVLGALKAQEFDRRMVSKFLHDKVGQNLTALGLQLDLVRMDLEAVSPETSDRVKEIQCVLDSMMEEVRDYSYELNPSTAERAGLRSALDRLVSRFRGRFSGAIRVNADPSLRLDPKMASALFQIAQEAVENAVQHSSCSTVEIAVKSTRAGISLEVRDNGRGFDPSDIASGRRGLGLLSMEHHAAQAGLELSVRSSRTAGTIVRAAAPEAV